MRVSGDSGFCLVARTTATKRQRYIGHNAANLPKRPRGPLPPVHRFAPNFVRAMESSKERKQRGGTTRAPFYGHVTALNYDAEPYQHMATSKGRLRFNFSCK